MSTALTQAMIVNGAVLVSVLATDLGPARTIGRMRLLRPLIVAGVIVPLFVKGMQTSGMGLTLEVAGTVFGIMCGLAAVGLMGVYRSPDSGRPVSRAGFGYAVLWTGIVGARAAFSYGSEYWFPNQLVHFGMTNDVTVAGLTDTLVFMAVAMLATRTLGLAVRAKRLAPAGSGRVLSGI